MIIETSEDMLIATRAYMDKMEGFRNESFEPEEIGLVLNKCQLRLLDNLINKNFEQGKLRYEWIRPFLTQSSPLQVTWSGSSLESSLVPFPDGLIPIGSPDPKMYYLVSATGVSAIDSADGFESGCGVTPIDPDQITNKATKTVQIAVNETGETIDQTHNSFYGNNKKRPIAEAKGSGIIISRDETYIIKSVVFDYVITPEEIDVTSSEEQKLAWSSSAANVIIDYAVEYLRLTIEDPGYQANVNDLNLRTQNA